MYITQEMIARLAAGYGTPEEWDFSINVDRKEYDRIKSSQRDGRRHDFTVYIAKEGRIVVIAKHVYPPGLYRAPSGGVKPGEDPEAGMHREVWEETGCRVEIQRFLLKTNVRFVCGEDVIDWNSYVFQAAYREGDFEFTDTREIRQVRLAELSEFEAFARIMRNSGIGGLQYRAALHERVAPLLKL